MGVQKIYGNMYETCKGGFVRNDLQYKYLGPKSGELSGAFRFCYSAEGTYLYSYGGPGLTLGQNQADQKKIDFDQIFNTISIYLSGGL